MERIDGWEVGAGRRPVHRGDPVRMCLGGSVRPLGHRRSVNPTTRARWGMPLRRGGSVASGPMAGCVFCSIVAGEVSAHVVLDDPIAVGFLDARPLFPGHVLMVPRAHHETLTDLPVEQVGPFFARVQQMAGVVQQATGAAGTFVANNNTVSQSVPHLHVHVVPRTKGDGLKGFFWPRTTYADDAEAAEIAARIRAAWGSG